MLAKLSKQNRRKFLMSALVTMPISLVLGLALGVLVTEFIFLENSLQDIIGGFIFLLVLIILSLFLYYRNLLKEQKKEDK